MHNTAVRNCWRTRQSRNHHRMCRPPPPPRASELQVPQPVVTTHITPPTPDPPRTSVVTTNSPPESPTFGRLSAHNRDLLTAGFHQIEAAFQNIANNTGLPITQILALWDKKNGRETKSGNSWNIYEGYLKDPANQAEEIRRAGLTYRALLLIHLHSAFLMSTIACQITNEVRSQCFSKFKAAYPNSWSTILEAWQDAQMYDTPGQTIAQRARAFNKFVAQISERVCMFLPVAYPSY